MKVQNSDMRIGLPASGTNIASVKTEAPPAAREMSPPPDPEQVREAVKSINQTIKAMAQNIEFSVDQESGAMVTKIVDQSTHEVIRQVPSEEVLAISKSLDRMMGLLVRDKA